MKILLILVASLAAGSALAADAPATDPQTISQSRQHRVPRTQTPPTIDGRLDDPAWKTAASISLAYEVYPAENAPPPVETECLVTYDDTHLYVAFRAHDPDPSRIRAHLSDRDNAFRNDLVGIALDTFQDTRRGFAFMVNPLGVQMDAILQGVGGLGGYGNISGAPDEDYSWDAIWDSAGRIGPEGFSTEMAIPWYALRFPKGSGEQSWGVMAFRSYPRNLRHRILSSPVERDASCYLCEAKILTGLEGMRPGRGIDLTPTLTHQIAENQETFPDDPLVREDGQTDLGLTGRWGITPNLSLNATLNPDFSQVEADSARLDINRRFALFFPEKRPFFLEGADTFSSWFRAVHTRTVADPKWGIKLTGKEGRNGIGAFIARDRGTTLIFPANQGSSDLALDEESTTSVLRYRRDIGKSSNLGVLYTRREGDHGYSNQVGGVDGHLQFTDVDNIHFQFLRSTTQYGTLDAEGDGTLDVDQPEGSFTADAVNIGYTHDSRDWAWWAWYNSKDPGFRADAGFITRVDTRNSGAGVDRNFWGEEGDFFSNISTGIEYSRTEDHSGLLTNEYLGLNANLHGPYQSLFRGSISDSKTYFDGTLYDLTRFNCWFNIRPTGDFTSSIGVTLGDTVDYDNGQLARELRIRPGITWNIGRHLFIEFDHTFQRLTVDSGRLYEANLTESRVVYQFTRRLFARAILQRVAVDRELANYLPQEDLEAESRSVFSQLLLSYKVNPQTVVFLGYTDQRRSNESADLTTTNRSLFFKLGYAWVL